MRRPPPLTPAQRDRVKRLAKTNSKPQIARKMKLPLSRVRRFCIANDIETKSALHAPLEGINLAALVLKLGTVQAVADKFGVSRQAVYLRLEQ
jgi:DNA invertase Pin-like site-specific DNA recombinase